MRVDIASIKNQKSNNFLVPLDSEHFSLYNSNIKNNNIQNYITAWWTILLNKNKLIKCFKSRVLSHPKWKMGKNNLIDSLILLIKF